MSNIGIFKETDNRLEGVKWGNWGSRPYEYHWASNIISVENKKVIDLGVGLPSQYDWYLYVVDKLKPVFYAGIDYDGRILNEIIRAQNFEILHMDMAFLKYKDQEFDIAYCISTFEHVPYDTFMKSIKETHRVLKNDGFLIITLDEEWDKTLPLTHGNGWNTLEQSLIELKKFNGNYRSFGLPDFLDLIKEYFTLVQEDAIINLDTGDISSSEKIYYHRENRDNNILNSGEAVNSCVSYAILKKV